MRFTSPARTLLDLAALLNPRALGVAFDRGRDERIVSMREIASVLDRHRGRRGTRLRRSLCAAEAEPTITRSRAERRMLALIGRAGLPRPLVNFRTAGYEVDLYWPDHGLVVEIDGYAFHHRRSEFERDRLREQVLLGAGLRVSRVMGRQIVDHPAEVAARLAAALGAVL
jgi:hypothetical protein